MDTRYTFLYLLILIIITASEHLIFHKKRVINCRKYITSTSKYWYQAPIPYNHLRRFIFVGMKKILYFYLIWFIPYEIHYFFPLLYFYKIRFCNCFEATLKKASAVILIRLLYPTHYWSIIDWFGHSRT